MKPTQKIEVATFSTSPAGRYVSDGEASGEVFRRDVLLDALNNAQLVEVVLDGTEGYGSSFLDEAFAGLIRDHGFSAQQFKDRIKLISAEDPSLIDEIVGYVEDEQNRRDAASRRR